AGDLQRRHDRERGQRGQSSIEQGRRRASPAPRHLGVHGHQERAGVCLERRDPEDQRTRHRRGNPQALDGISQCGADPSPYRSSRIVKRLQIAAGTRIGSYEIVDSLGAGGMGNVYRAADPRLGREIAIKTLPPALAQNPDALARFEREARFLAALNHPNIASIYGIEEYGGERFLILELVPGETLDALLARGPLPLEQTLRIALDVASALEAAHEAGIVHRDLKPSNVKITPAGRVKLLDFGIAKNL